MESHLNNLALDSEGVVPKALGGLVVVDLARLATITTHTWMQSYNFRLRSCVDGKATLPHWLPNVG